MSKIFSRQHLFPIIGFCFLDLVAIGAGMGVPIFAILLGFVVGWFLPQIIVSAESDLVQVLKRCLMASLLTSCLTAVVMMIIWIPTTKMLLDSSADFVNFGIPMILYDPRASFIGWILLMVVVSPFLQVLSTAFASAVRLAWRMPNSLPETTKQL